MRFNAAVRDFCVRPVAFIFPSFLSIIPSGNNGGNVVKFAALIVRPIPYWRKEDFARTRPLSGVYFNRAVAGV